MYTIIEFKGNCLETGNIFKKTPLIDKSDNFFLDKFILKTEFIKKNKKIKKVLFVYDPQFTAYPAQIEQIYKILRNLKNRGKELYFFSKIYDEKALFLSSVCDKRFMPEGGQVSFLGFKFEFTFYKRLLDKQKIKVEVYRRGKYKGAADRFRLDKIDEAQKEAYGTLLKRIYETFKDTIIQNFNLSSQIFENEIEGNIIYSEKAKQLNLITDISNLQKILDDFEKNKIKKFKLRIHKDYFGKGDKIAVLIFEGCIKDGKNSKNLLFGNSIGDEYFIKQIEKIKKDKSTKAVILKVNSPGGSALASDAIAEELLKLKKAKTLVVVQSGVAASGGYYISFPAEKIFSSATTITGSIGVINMLFYIKEFSEKYGITSSILKEGKHADIFSSYKERTEKEKKIIDNSVENFYKIFVDKVAKHRGKTFEQIDNIAQGRIWAGFDGTDIGIVDEIGDLYSAIDYIKAKLKLSKVKVEFFPKLKETFLDKVLKLSHTENIDSFFSNNKINNINIFTPIFDLLSTTGSFFDNNNFSNKIYYILPEILISKFVI